MTFQEFLTKRGLNESDLDADALTEQRAEYDREMAQRSASGGGDASSGADGSTGSASGHGSTGSTGSASGDANTANANAGDANADDGAQRTTPPDPQDAARQAVADERGRVNAIREEGQRSGIADVEIGRCEREGFSIDQARQAFLTWLQTNRPPSVGSVAIHSRSGDDLNTEVLEGAISMRAGVPVADAALTIATRRTHVDPTIAERADRFSDMSIIDMLREACRIDGVRIPHTRHEAIRAGFSTAAISNILANVQGKMLMGGFMETPNTARMWVRMTDVADFKAQRRTRLGEAEDLRIVNNGGEVEFGQTSDTGESFTLEQFAQLMVFTEQDVINDDLGALSDQPRRMGAASSRLESDTAYRILLANAALDTDGIALFAAAHNNLITGASTVLSADSLANLIELLALQTDIQGAKLSVQPRHFLYPPELWFLARQLVRSTEVRSNAGQDQPTSNPLAEIGLNPISEPRLSLGVGTTAGSTTAFFVLGDANQVPTVELAFLRGTGRAPRIEQVPLTPNLLGIGWRVVHAVAAKALDFRGVTKSDGA